MAKSETTWQAGAPRLLIVTTTLPGEANVGGLVLGDLLADYPQEKYQLAHLVPPETDSAVNDISVPAWAARKLEGKLDSIKAHTQFVSTFVPGTRLAADALLAAIDRFEPDKVWLILDTPAAIMVAGALVEKSDVPILSLVWDAPDYLLIQGAFGRMSRHVVLDNFAAVLSKSEKIAVVSDAMQEGYEAEFGRPCVILRHGLTAASRRAAATALHSDNELLIGFAGGLYAKDAWSAFLAALDSIEWKVGKRQIRLRLMGESFVVKSKCAARVEYLGYRDSIQTAELLAECDVNYLPQPFQERLKSLAEFAFPTKLSTYVTTGRPVLVHAPPYGSLRRFCERHQIGAVVDSLEPHAIAAAIDTLVSEEAYQKASANAARVAEKELGAEQFHAAFRDFLGENEA